jgi:DNA primase
VVLAGLEHPEWLDDHLEALEAQGLAEPALQALITEVIGLRLAWDEGEGGLDSKGLVRHLADRGYGALLTEIAAAATKSSAPFLSAEPPQAQKESWSQAFEVLIRMAALESALSAAKADASRGLDAGAFSRLKAERDALRRAIKSGTLWADSVS